VQVGIAVGFVVLSLASGSESVAPPSRPGPWRELGGVAVSRPGKAVRLFRTALDPRALAIVVSSRSPATIRVFWSTDCEVFDDDTMEAQQQARVSGVGRVDVYPRVLAGATRCYVFATATVGGRGRVSAAEFSY
jgi:hypothetical protein